MVGLAGPLFHHSLRQTNATPSSYTPHDDLILPRGTLTHQSMASMPLPRLLPPSSSAHADPIASKFSGKAPSSLAHASRLALPHFKKAYPGPSRVRSGPFLCRSHKSTPADDQDDGSSVDGASSARGWDSLVHSVVVGAAKKWGDFINAWRSSWPTDGSSDIDALAGKEEGGKEMAMEVEDEEDGGNWDWERWKRHFLEIEEQEKLVSDLKSQLDDAISREDYEDAAKLKLAIDRAIGNDAVGIAISIMNRAIEEERFNDAAFIRDHAGAGLIGWWSGISVDGADPYGRIVCISAEHGRYVARSYSPRQLATGRSGFPLFEIFFTRTDEEYKQQVAYLKQHGNSGGSIKNSEENLGFSNLNSYDRSKEESRLHAPDVKTGEDRDDDSSLNDGVSIIQNVLRDLIPGVKIRVLKMVSPGKVNRDAIAKVVEQIMEEEEEGSEEDGSDEEFESIEPEDLSAENDIEEIELDARDSTSPNDRKSEVSIKFVIGGLTPKLLTDGPSSSITRLPARLERRDNTSFSIILEEDAINYEIDGKRQASKDKAFPQKSANLISFEIAKVIPDKEKIHLKGGKRNRDWYFNSYLDLINAVEKLDSFGDSSAALLSSVFLVSGVLKDLQELISYSVNNRQNYQSLFETTLFNRIEAPSTSDPLSGLYIGSHGMYSSNVLHLKRKFGQWQDHTSDKHKILEFYEYVEAIKLTGDPSVPAGQVAFRAKLGKQNQLPHKGIIPEEFGVIARYRGQGRLADPGYRNPRWVDGELVIFDGKYIRGGPAIGFVYWAPESHFLLLFNRLRLPA